MSETEQHNWANEAQDSTAPIKRRMMPAPVAGKRLDPEFRAELVDFAKARINDVWADVPQGVDAETLAQNVVAAQEFAWIARGYPVAEPQGESSEELLKAVDHVQDALEFQDAINPKEVRVIIAAALSKTPGPPRMNDCTVIASGNVLGFNYCPEHGDLLPVGDAKDSRSDRCWEAHSVGEILRSEQGEPSDAVIVDMLTAFYGEERDGWSMSKVRRMRAALRAAMVTS